MLTNVLNHIILYAPLDEIQLGYSRMNFIICSRNSIGNLGRATKGVEEFFTVSIEAGLVSTMNTEYLSIICLVRKIILFGIIGDEPLEVPKGDASRLVEKFLEDRSILGQGVKRVYG